MSVPLGRSPPVLRAGVRGKLDLAWRFGSSGRVGAVRQKQPAVLHSWRRRGGGLGVGGTGGERRRRLTDFDPLGCQLFRRDVMSRQLIFEHLGQLASSTNR
jgi:hypothetical protein